MHTLRAAALALGMLGGAAVAAQAVTPPTAHDLKAIKAAERPIVVQHPASMLEDMTSKLAPTLPPDHRERFVALMRDPSLALFMEQRVRDAMARHFTVDELNAMADFYARPVARSAMSKMGSYMADIQPALMKEIGRRAQAQEGR